MFGSVRVAFAFLILAVAGSAKAQGDLDRGKTGAQLYASACATCHKSPPSISKTKWLFGIESFLREHYTSSSESAAILAAYLKGQEKPSNESQPGRDAKHVKQVSNSTVNEFGEEIPRPPADIPDVRH
jgi:mono/diheme cytochrome c family protein